MSVSQSQAAEPGASAQPGERNLARWGIALIFIMGLHHGILWLMVMARTGTPFSTLLNHWDAGWYTLIATSGYTPQAMAYYPLYPVVVKVLGLAASSIGLSIPLSIIGFALSTMLALGLFALVLGLVRRGESAASGLVPASTLGFFFFVYAPGSYVFHSHHTESLFIILVFGALLSAHRKRFVHAAVLAGLAALTRNQGVLLALAIGIAALMSRTTDGRSLPLKQRVATFAKIGLISGSIYALYPAWLWYHHGDPLGFASAKVYWTHASDVASYFRTFWLGNPGQTASSGSLLRHFLFWASVAGTVLAFQRKSFAPALYCALSLALIPVQSEFAGVVRYNVALFPALFALGDWTAQRPLAIRVVVVIFLIWFNHMVTRNYALARWAY